MDYGLRVSALYAAVEHDTIMHCEVYGQSPKVAGIAATNKI